MDIIDTFLKSQPKSRNAHLARLHLASFNFKSGNATMDDMFAAGRYYWDCNKNKLYCYHDIYDYLSRRDKSWFPSFVEYTSQEQADGDGVCEVNFYVGLCTDAL